MPSPRTTCPCPPAACTCPYKVQKLPVIHPSHSIEELARAPLQHAHASFFILGSQGSLPTRLPAAPPETRDAVGQGRMDVRGGRPLKRTSEADLRGGGPLKHQDRQGVRLPRHAHHRVLLSCVRACCAHAEEGVAREDGHRLRRPAAERREDMLYLNHGQPSDGHRLRRPAAAPRAASLSSSAAAVPWLAARRF
jgi:hypothetical protein